MLTASAHNKCSQQVLVNMSNMSTWRGVSPSCITAGPLKQTCANCAPPLEGLTMVRPEWMPTRIWTWPPEKGFCTALFAEAVIQAGSHTCTQSDRTGQAGRNTQTGQGRQAGTISQTGRIFASRLTGLPSEAGL